MKRTTASVPIIRVAPPANPMKSPYFFQDPIRLSAMICAILLMWVREVPFTLGLFAIGVSQLNGVAMVIDILGSGWTSKFGRRTRSSLFTSSLAMDWVNVSVCTLVGAMFLMRLFGPPMLVTALGWLTLAIALVPDIRICRLMLPNDATRANAVLTDGWFFRDPVKLGALAAMLVVCFLDRTSLAFIFVSTIMLQLSSLLVMVDKYLAEVEGAPASKVPFRGLRLLIDRDGQRLLLALLPLVLVPLRMGTPDQVPQYVVGAIAALVILPDFFRAIGRVVGSLLGLIPGRSKAAAARA
jgi:hypothetical protein